MVKNRILFTLLIVILITLSACVQGEFSNSSETTPRLNPSSEGEQAKEMETVNPELIAIGEKQVKVSCIYCHGGDLRGEMGPSLYNLQDRMNQEQLIDVLITGKGSMMPGTADGKEEAVAAYLFTLID